MWAEVGKVQAENYNPTVWGYSLKPGKEALCIKSLPEEGPGWVPQAHILLQEAYPAGLLWHKVRPGFVQRREEKTEKLDLDSRIQHQQGLDLTNLLIN